MVSSPPYVPKKEGAILETDFIGWPFRQASTHIASASSARVEETQMLEPLHIHIAGEGLGTPPNMSFHSYNPTHHLQAARATGVGIRIYQGT